MSTLRSFALILVLVMTALQTSAGPAAAFHATISGTVTDATTGVALADVCVTLGPPIVCFTRTDANGYYSIDLRGANDTGTWDLYFLKQPSYQTAYSEKFEVTGPTQWSQALLPVGRPELCPAASTALPTRTVYLPNITRQLGGAAGFQTPFIVQNTGSVPTSLELTFFRFLNGACALRKTIVDLRPGTSYAHSPNDDPGLPADTQFSVVVNSFGAPVVAVVNEHQAVGTPRAEALSYDGFSEGSTRVFLPNITRRFFGYVTPFIIQNLGIAHTVANARFVTFDNSAPPLTVTRSIDAGKSRFIDPNSEPGLVDGQRYSVTITSPAPVAVVVNTHNDAPTVAEPVAYSASGIATGAAAVFGAYGAKNAQGVGRVTTIVVQNVGTAPLMPNITFYPLGGGTAPAQTFASPAPIAVGAAWEVDPRFALGTTTPCSGASQLCLGDGEYTFVARAGDDVGRIAAAVNVIGLVPSTAMGYTASPTPSVRYFLPNVTRTLGGVAGWTTPILVQSITATGVTLRWYRFSDGQLMHTQFVALQPNRGERVDPRDIFALADDTQYAVVADGQDGAINAIVIELAGGGDNAMIYEGFPAP